MRKIRILAVGNIKEKFFQDAVDEYAQRLKRFCELSISELREYSEVGGIEREGDLILKNLSGYVVLFDRQGIQPSSEQFAALIDRAYCGGRDTITFVIGGSLGVCDRVKARADQSVSFGNITYPHRLMRVIALEQIYRAFTITENMPYHK